MPPTAMTLSAKNWAESAHDPRLARAAIESVARALRNLSGGALDPAQVAQAVDVELRTSPAADKLRACSVISIVNATLACARLSLIPGAQLGHAYLVPYGKTATLLVGYKGLVMLATRDGGASSVIAHAIHEGDDFSAEETHAGVSWRFHRPLDRPMGKVIGSFCVITPSESGQVPHLRVCHLEEIMAARARSKQSSGPWSTDFAAMAKKTAVRRGLAIFPLRGLASAALAAAEVAPRAVEVLDVEAELPAAAIEAGQALAEQIAEVPDDEIADAGSLPDGEPATPARGAAKVTVPGISASQATRDKLAACNTPEEVDALLGKWRDAVAIAGKTPAPEADKLFAAVREIASQVAAAATPDELDALDLRHAQTLSRLAEASCALTGDGRLFERRRAALAALAAPSEKQISGLLAAIERIVDAGELADWAHDLAEHDERLRSHPRIDAAIAARRAALEGAA